MAKSKHKNAGPKKEPTRVTLRDFDRSTIPQPVYQILKLLRKAGHDAFLVGGCVRDYLLGVEPKDFDIVTNARPERVKKVIHRSRVIGRRFRLVHVPRHGEIYEVATYRQKSKTSIAKNKRSPGVKMENAYGTQYQDAFRRDFTVNSLLFNPSNKQVIDYTGGLEDIERQVLRSIGPAKERFAEDPVRILRALRLSSKLNLTLDSEVEDGIWEMCPRLQLVKSARLRDEFAKLLLNGCGQLGFGLLAKYGIAQVFFPYQEEDDQFIRYAMHNTDERVAMGEPVSIGFLYSVLLWCGFKRNLDSLLEKHPHLRGTIEAQYLAFEQLQNSVKLMRGLTRSTRDFEFALFCLQPHLESQEDVGETLKSRYIRPAVHLLNFRSKVGEVNEGCVNWWKQRQPARKKKSSRKSRRRRMV